MLMLCSAAQEPFNNQQTNCLVVVNSRGLRFREPVKEESNVFGKIPEPLLVSINLPKAR